MPKPQAVYLRIKAKDKSAAAAAGAKESVASASDDGRERFYKALDRVAQGDLKTWHKSMQDLARTVESGEPVAEADKVRKTYAKAIKQVRKILTEAKDFKELRSSMQRPATAVIRAPNQLPAAGIELALVIAVCQILKILVVWRRRK